MKEDTLTVMGTILMVLITLVVYITNFVQFINCLASENYERAIVKGIGVFTALGSFITVWY